MVMNNTINKIGTLQTEYHSDSAFPISIYKLTVGHKNIILPHYHDNFEIIYVKHGNLIIRIGNESYRSDQKDIFFTNMFQVHSVDSVDGKNSELYAIVFDKSILDTININNYYLEYIKPFLEGERWFPARISSNNHLFDKLSLSLDLIISEFNSKEIAYELFIKTEVEKLFAIMIRFNIYFNSENCNNITLENKKIINSMWKFIKVNYRNKITLDEIAQALNINKYYFCRLVKNLTGKSFTQLLNIHRVYHSKELLQETNLPVTEISEICGFSNQSNFNRIYLKNIGNTPTETRKGKLKFYT